MKSLNGHAKVAFRGPQYEVARKRLRAGKSIALLGQPGSGKTLCAKMLLLDICGYHPDAMTHDKLDEVFRHLVEIERIYYLQGTESTEAADVVGSFVRASEISCGDCGWRTLAYESTVHAGTCPECRSKALHKDELGLVFRYGPFANALRYGKPFFWNEMFRCPQETQDVAIPALSEGILSVPQTGETILASPGFVMVADMNTEEHDAKAHSFCWALGSRLRKVEFAHPDATVVEQVLRDRVADGLVDPLLRLYNDVELMYRAGDVQRPILIRGLLEMASDVEIERKAGASFRDAFVSAATYTWRGDVVGTRASCGPSVDELIAKVGDSLVWDEDAGEAVMRDVVEIRRVETFLKDVLGLDRLGFSTVRILCDTHGITAWPQLWSLVRSEVTFADTERFGATRREHLKNALYLTAQDVAQTLGEREDLTWRTVEKYTSIPFKPGMILGFALHDRARVASETVHLAEMGVTNFRQLRNAESQITPVRFPRLRRWMDENVEAFSDLAKHAVRL